MALWAAIVGRYGRVCLHLYTADIYTVPLPHSPPQTHLPAHNMSHPYSDLSQFSVPGLDPAATAAAPDAAAVAAGLAAMAAQQNNPPHPSPSDAEPSPHAATAGAGAFPYRSAVLAADSLSPSATAGASASQASFISLPCGQPRLLSASQENLAADSAALSAQLAARPPLTDIAQPSLIGAGSVLLIDFKSVRHTHTRDERANFLLHDLCLPPGSIAAAFVAPITSYFMVELYPAFEVDYRRALRRLAEGVPWKAAGGRLVHGWTPGEALESVRVVGVPAALDHSLITDILACHGRVVTGPNPGRDPMLNCLDGTLHYKMYFPADLPPLPTFISVELESRAAGPNFVLQIYTDNPPRRCYRCGGHNHLGTLCRFQPRTIADQGALWARLQIPTRLPAPVAPTPEVITIPTSPPPACHINRPAHQQTNTA